ncbi:hypothetical protein, partial [Escherichia coli]
GKKSAQIREILISESTWEEMTCLFAPSLGFIAWAATFILFSRIFYYTTRFIYALKFAVAMTIANMGYQALCLYIDNSFAITRISPLWAGLIGVCTFIAALLLTSKR